MQYETPYWTPYCIEYICNNRTHISKVIKAKNLLQNDKEEFHLILNLELSVEFLFWNMIY